MMTPQKICALLTHQISRGSKQAEDYTPDNMAVKKILKQQIDFLINCHFTHFITGLELGADTWCAEILIILKRQCPHLYLECLLPFERQADNWDRHQRENYFNLIPQCDQVAYISQRETKNCRYLRDKQMINQANIALLLGATHPPLQSPTVAYAQQTKTPLIYIDHHGLISPTLSLLF